MVVRIDSLLASIWMRFPQWLGYVELVRVGSNMTDFVRVGFVQGK